MPLQRKKYSSNITKTRTSRSTRKNKTRAAASRRAARFSVFYNMPDGMFISPRGKALMRENAIDATVIFNDKSEPADSFIHIDPDRAVRDAVATD